MPIIKSAIKRAKQTLKRRERNIGIKKDIKTAVKAFSATPSAKTLSAAQSKIDTAVKKGLIKKNTAARRKSALSKIAKKAGVTLEAAKKPATKPATTKKPAAAKKTTAKKAPAKKPATKKTEK
ncbi:30S ribosomal protein S20 [Candidatus Nanosynbacter lyticus]|uniref:30S ribosomal protein S20 n=1 Tax=Candidatus Nanosynbacter lyticus TaxID=2093824 RepID=UPI0038D142C5